MTTNIFIALYVVSAILMIMVTQLTRKMFSRTIGYHTGCITKRPAICNGVRCVLILLALIPIANMVALPFTIGFIVADYVDGNIEFNGGNDNKLLKWWRK